MKTLKFAALSLLLAFATGCPSGSSSSGGGGTATAAGAGDKVLIRGSNTFGEELGPRLGESYKKDNPTVDFDIEAKGTVYGVGALLAAKCDIAGASRPFLKEELELAKVRGVEYNDYVIGAYCVAVVVNANNPVKDLTKDQVRDIFTGTVKNWKEVGGPDASITLYGRDPISGTYYGFKELAMEGKAYATEMKLYTNYLSIVQGVAADPNGIGYTSFALETSTGVKAVSIGGIEPTPETVNKSQYPYSRTVHLFTNKEKETPRVRDFIQFVQSTKGQEILTQTGFTPKL